MPLDQHVEGGHGEGQPCLKIGPAPMQHLLHMALRHEVARLIVWQAVLTKPVVPSAVELFPNKEEGRLYSKKLWRKPTDGNPSERRASHESLNRLVPGPIRRLVARFQRHLRGHTMETL